MLKTLRRIWICLVEAGTTWALLLSGVATIVLAAATAVAAVLRYVFLRPEPYSYEVALIVLVVASLLSIPGTQKVRRHPVLRSLVDRLPGSLQLGLDGIFVPIVALVCVVPTVIYSWLNAWHSLKIGEVTTSVLRVPLFPVKVVVTLGFGLLLVVLVGQLAEGIRAWAPAVRASGRQRQTE
jgi:TRAP-type C4-dicarboxylate transport system permease small subunit